MKADLHIHSNFSDGSDSIENLIKNIISAGVDIFALSDHDTIEGCLEMKKLVPSNIRFIPAVELTCKAEDVKCHILGYYCDPENLRLKSLIEKGKVLRRKKLETRIEYLKTVHGISLTPDELNWLYSRRSVVKTHLANILVKRGLAANNLDAMAKYLDGCKTGNTRFDGAEGINSIKTAGGISIWAHPLGGEGERHISSEEFYKKFEILKSAGIQGLECYYSRYNFDEINFLVNFARTNNLLISGGSDYHGANKDIPLGKLNTEYKPVDSKCLTILNP